MRLDKLLSECGLATRSESGKAARAGKITVNGIPVRKADVKVDPDYFSFKLALKKVLS